MVHGSVCCIVQVSANRRNKQVLEMADVDIVLLKHEILTMISEDNPDICSNLEIPEKPETQLWSIEK